MKGVAFPLAFLAAGSVTPFLLSAERQLVMEKFGSEKLLRLWQVLEIVPVSRATWWNWVAIQKAPAPLKLSPRVTCWRESDILQFIAEQK